MKVYIIYDNDGWEICGIGKAFSTREKAEQYLISEHARTHMKKYNKLYAVKYNESYLIRREKND